LIGRIIYGDRRVGKHIYIYSTHQKYVDKYIFTNLDFSLVICSDSTMYLKIVIYSRVGLIGSANMSHFLGDKQCFGIESDGSVDVCDYICKKKTHIKCV
jgi:hypothetical protein